ncbi:hypothetical protein QYF36_003995 [Acer negundo]|nr:hypothetical protein QYF36_003995 [Acer negundo]
MECGWSWEQKTLMSELIEGMKSAKKLRVHLGSTSSVETSDVLVQRILSSYEKALLILKWPGPGSTTVQAQATIGAAAANCGVPESPISNNGSPTSDDFDGVFKDNLDNQENSKKRKTQPRWTDKVRVSFESGLEGPQEDGFSWRKYGQKDILAAKYPRSYYRCTYRNTQNCWATKQVQRSDEDPTIFEITYRGTHTCSHGQSAQSVPLPPSPEKQEKRLNHHNSNNNNNYQQQQQQQSQDILSNLRKGLSVNTNGLDNREMEPPFTFPSTSFGYTRTGDHCFTPSMLDENTFLGFSSTYTSPSTPESNYFLCQMNSFGDVQGFGASVPELLSGNNSSANSPILNMDFSLDPAEIDPNFLI